MSDVSCFSFLISFLFSFSIIFTQAEAQEFMLETVLVND